jgi:two-component sensor histidine kinase
MEGNTEAETSQNSSRSRSDLLAELRRRDLPRHLALFYESRSEQFDAVAAFLEHGLTTNHKCLYLHDESTPQQIRDILRTTTLNVDHHLNVDDLVIRDASEVYLDSGFEPDQMIQTLENTCEKSVDEGYEGLFVAGENSWCFHTELTFDPILNFEADFDATCPELPVVALCQYDLTRFGEKSAAKALWTHVNVIYRNTICQNPFYIPPGKYYREVDKNLNVKLMLEQVYSLTNSQRQVERHKQRLEVVNRVLRHNIRNDINVIQASLQLVQGADALTSDVEDRLAIVRKHANQILDMAERARYVQETIEDSTVETISLGSAIETAITEISTVYPDAEINVAGSQDLSVLGDTNLDLALTEALRNRIIHQKNEPAPVSLSISTPTTDAVWIDVESPESIPESDQKPIQQGYETQLEHVSGLSLWLVQWIVENSTGSLTFPDTETGKTKIRLQLRRSV